MATGAAPRPSPRNRARPVDGTAFATAPGMRLVGLLVAAALAVVGMLASGCVSRTEGQLGHASFSYEECAFGCTVTDNAMAAGGAHAVISVELSSGYSFAQVKSTNPAVAQLALASGGFGGGIPVDVTSGAAGTTTLQLLDARGKLVDAVNVTVADTARLAFTQGWTGAAPLVLAGTTQYFHVTTEDVHGKSLIGTGAVAFELAGPLHATGLYLGGDGQGFAGDPGAGSVTAHTDGASATLAVTVVPASAIASVSAVVEPNTMSGAQTYGNVEVTARTADGVAVYGATCAWTPAGGLTVQSQSAASLEAAAAATTQFLLPASGASFDATCTIGAVSTSVTLHR